MSRIRKQLSFENVLVTAIAFVVLAGGTAFAANQLAKNSVGKKQLKANAVTTAKIKKNAVTAAKIKAGAIDGKKVKDGSLALADLNSASLPFGHVVHKTQGPTSIALKPPYAVIPLDSPAYTQEAGRDDTVVGSADLSFDPACTGSRFIVIYVLLDVPDPTKLVGPDAVDTAVAVAIYQDEAGTGPNNARMNLGPYAPAGSLSPAAPANHTLSVVGLGGCESGQPAIVSNFSLAVVGVK